METVDAWLDAANGVLWRWLQFWLLFIALTGVALRRGWFPWLCNWLVRRAMIRAAALYLVETYGAEARARVAARLSDALDRDDLQELAQWQAVGERVDRLMRRAG